MIDADTFKYRLLCWLRDRAAAGRLPWASDGRGTRLHALMADVIGVRAEGCVERGLVNLQSSAADTAPKDCCALILPTALMSFVAADVARPADWDDTPVDLSGFLHETLGDEFSCWRRTAGPPDRSCAATWLFDAPWQQGFLFSLHGYHSIAFIGTLGCAERARESGCPLQRQADAAERATNRSGPSGQLADGHRQPSVSGPRGNGMYGADCAKQDAAARAFATLVTSCAARPTHRGGK